jgi:hypothetical protein
VMSRPEESAEGCRRVYVFVGGMHVLKAFDVVAPGISVTCQVIYGLRDSTDVSAIDMSESLYDRP